MYIYVIMHKYQAFQVQSLGLHLVTFLDITTKWSRVVRQGCA